MCPTAGGRGPNPGRGASTQARLEKRVGQVKTGGKVWTGRGDGGTEQGSRVGHEGEDEEIIHGSRSEGHGEGGSRQVVQEPRAQVGATAGRMGA